MHQRSSTLGGIRRFQIRNSELAFYKGFRDIKWVVDLRRAVGVEINPELVQQARQNTQKAGVADRVEFLQQDLFQTELKDATVVTLYLLPSVNRKLRPKLLQKLKPGTRIVSHDFDMGDWKPNSITQVKGPFRRHTLYYWVVPNKPLAEVQ